MFSCTSLARPWRPGRSPRAVPPLAVRPSAGSTMSPSTTPGVRMTCRSMSPQVSSRHRRPWPRRCEENVWVAPELHRLLALELDRVDGDDPAWRRRCAAPCTALMPMPPMPITATVSPGLMLGPVHGRAEAGGHAAGHERHRVQREVGLDLDDARSRPRACARRTCRAGRSGRCVLAAAGGRCARRSSCPSRTAWRRGRRGSAGRSTHHLQRPQRGMNDIDDVVAAADAGDAGADRLDDAGALVAADERVVRQRACRR